MVEEATEKMEKEKWEPQPGGWKMKPENEFHMGKGSEVLWGARNRFTNPCSILLWAPTCMNMEPNSISKSDSHSRKYTLGLGILLYSKPLFTS